MLQPKGCDCSTCTDASSEPKDATPTSPQPMATTTLDFPDMGLFQRAMLLMEAMNRLKFQVHTEKLSHCSNLNHLEMSSDKEEIEVPISSVPLISSSLLPLQTLENLLSDTSLLLPSAPVTASPETMAHIPIMPYKQVHINPAVLLPLAPLASQPPLSATDWSLLINKVQSGELPSITISPQAITPQLLPPAITSLPTEETTICLWTQT